MSSVQVVVGYLVAGGAAGCWLLALSLAELPGAICNERESTCVSRERAAFCLAHCAASSLARRLAAVSAFFFAAFSSFSFLAFSSSFSSFAMRSFSGKCSSQL